MKPVVPVLKKPLNATPVIKSKGKAILFDASTLISLSMAGLIWNLKKLKEIFKGHFILTQDVQREVIDKPLTIKRFELEALRAKKLLDDGVFETPIIFGISEEEISKRTQEIKQIANTSFNARGKDLHIIDSGEASCLALGQMLNKRGIQTALAVDERTTRVLGEKPENLKKILEKKLHINITQKKQNFAQFKELKFIRSSELVYVIYKKGLTELKDGQTVLDALLYSVKFKGCAVSGNEIEEIKQIK